MKDFAAFIFAAYRFMARPWLSPCCRFSPSCSEYAEEALRRHGFFKGTRLSLARLWRCRPLCSSGFDPVPNR